MEVTAVARHISLPPRKARFIVNTIRGKKVEEALALLGFLPSPSARAIAKIVKSAAANAENNYQMVPADLRIVKIYVDGGRTLKRYRARARGRASPILKRSSHITVVVKEEA